MQASANLATQPKTFSQHRRWLKTSFGFDAKHLDYRIDNKQDASVQEKIAWDRFAAPASHFHIVEADRALRWVIFAMTALALFAVLRGGPQPLTLGIHLAFAGILLMLTLATQRWRQVAYTAIPAASSNVLVLEDRQHDSILSAIEAARTRTLLRSAEPGANDTIRQYLSRLRWLAEQGALTADEFARRQALVLPNESRSLLAPQPATSEPRLFRQQRFGMSIELDLRTDRLIYRRAALLGTTETFNVPYRNLQEPSAHFDTDHQYELVAVLFAWCGIFAFAWGAYVSQGLPPDHYVGGIGLQRAIADFWPSFAIMAAGALLIPLATRLRCGRPYPGIVLLRDRQYDAIVSAIEQNRLDSIRRLAEPDPLLRHEEQMGLLEELHDVGILTEDEYRRAAQRSALVCDNPDLDQPIAGDREQPRVKEYALH